MSVAYRSDLPASGTFRRMTWQFTVTGLLIGALRGLTGMGGGSLMTPILIFLFGFDPAVAIGTDILHGAIFKSFGAARHRRLGQVHARLALWMLLGSAPMSLVGVAFGTWLQHRYGSGVQHLQEEILGYALVACGLGFVLKALIQTTGKSDLPLVLQRRDKVIAVTLGLARRLRGRPRRRLAAARSFGLVLMLVFPLTAAKIVGTDLSSPCSGSTLGRRDRPSRGRQRRSSCDRLAAARLDPRRPDRQQHATVRLPDRTIRVALATTLTLSGFKLIDFPGSSVAVLVGLGVGIGAFAGRARPGSCRLVRASRPELGQVVPLELVLRERRQPAGLATHLATPLLLATGLGGVQRVPEAPLER